MKSFELSTGTTVVVSDTKIEIDRNGGKSAMKGLFSGRAMGLMTIKLSSVTGVIHFADYLLICASGLSSPADFKITSIAEIKQYPNCVIGKQEELKQVYDYINGLI